MRKNDILSNGRIEMETVKKFLTIFSSGKSFDAAWKEAGFASLKDLRVALKELAGLLPDRSITGVVSSPESFPGLEISDNKRIVVHSDGAARGNPGPASIAAVAYSASGELLGSFSEFIGKATNNEAEYKALILGIELAHHLGVDSVIFRLDSELVVKQIRGEYKIKKPHLAELAEIVKKKTSYLTKITYEHIPRSENMEADRLANEVLDRLKKDGMI